MAEDQSLKEKRSFFTTPSQREEASKEEHGPEDMANNMKEHILICLSGAPSNPKVIQAGARLARAFHGRFTALYVEAPDTAELSGENHTRLLENLRLAEALGAHVVTVYGDDIPAQITEYARTSGVSKIVAGRSNNHKWRILSRSTLTERLAELAPDLDIYIIPGAIRPSAAPKEHRIPSVRLSFTDLVKTCLILGAASLISIFFFQWHFRQENLIMVYLLAVLFISMCTESKVYGAAGSFVSVLIFNYLFTDPYYTFQFNDPGYYITFGIMFLASFITSTLTARVRGQERQAVRKAYRTEVLLETSQKLQRAESRENAFEQMAQQFIRLLGKTVVVYPVTVDGLGEPEVYGSSGKIDKSSLNKYVTDDEQAVAFWVRKQNRHAGAGTDTLPGARCLYMAVGNHNVVFAVVGVAMDDNKPLDVFERNILTAMLGEFALALEKMHSEEEKRQAEVRVRQEQLRANLLRAISHDLRTPLTSISGNAGILLNSEERLDKDKKRQLYMDIYDDAMWLINLVENLLSVTRIENGSMNIQMEPELLDEVFQEALSHLTRKSAEHQIRYSVSDDLLMAWMDSRLLIQVLINLVNNAVKYTPVGSEILVSAVRDGEMVRVEVADNGPGVSDEVKPRLFEMFFTGERNHSGDGRRGLGLGLALCKSIVEAHGGRIGVRDNVPRGTVFFFTLKAQEVDCHV